MGFIFHKYEEEKSKLHFYISSDQWIHLFSEGQSEEDQQELIRAVHP